MCTISQVGGARTVCGIGVHTVSGFGGARTDGGFIGARTVGGFGGAHSQQVRCCTKSAVFVVRAQLAGLSVHAHSA